VSEECDFGECRRDRVEGKTTCWVHTDPPFDAQLWPSVESRLGRALTPEENERIHRMGAMRKECFFGEVWSRDREGVERLVATCHLSSWGRPQKSIVQRLWDWVFGR
jgi:hypothetical protein